MAQDITLAGAQYNGVPSILLPKTGGGQAEFIDKDAWNWVSVEPKYKQTLIQFACTLADTDYADWAASTTAHTLIATNDAAAFTALMSTTAYLIKWQWQVTPVYESGITLKAVPIVQCGEFWQMLYRRPSNYANLIADNYNGNVAITTRSVPLMVYYNTSGNLAAAFSASNGVYCAATAPTLSSATAASPTVTVKTPTVSCKCSSTYFATGRKAYISTDTKIQWKCDLYELPMLCAETQMHQSLLSLYSNPLNIPLPEPTEP